MGKKIIPMKQIKISLKRLIGSVDLKKHPEWKTPQKVRKWVRKLREEWR